MNINVDIKIGTIIDNQQKSPSFNIELDLYEAKLIRSDMGDLDSARISKTTQTLRDKLNTSIELMEKVNKTASTE